MEPVIFLFAWVSLILALSSYLCGARAIIKGPAHPSMISRFFWLALSVTNLLSYWNLGAGYGLFLAITNTVGCVLIFILSLRYGYIEFKWTDIITIVGSCASILCYVFLPQKILTLGAGLLTHFISGIPTYKKTFPNPYSEDLAFWSLFAFASFCSLITVILEEKNFVYPFYFFLFDSIMTLIIIRQRRVHKFRMV